MEILYPRCAAIDVHKRTAVAAVGWVDAQGRRHRQVRTDATMTADIERLCQWFTEHGVAHVAMESTGVYWKPLFNLLARGRAGRLRARGWCGRACRPPVGSTTTRFTASTPGRTAREGSAADPSLSSWRDVTGMLNAP